MSVLENKIFQTLCVLFFIVIITSIFKYFNICEGYKNINMAEYSNPSSW